MQAPKKEFVVTWEATVGFSAVIYADTAAEALQKAQDNEYDTADETYIEDHRNYEIQEDKDVDSSES